MKKILYVLLTIILAVTVSSYTMPSIDKTVTKGDSISVNINVRQTKIPQPKTDVLYEKLLKALDSNTELNENKKVLIQKMIEEDKDQSISTLDRLCYERGYDTTKVLKLAEKEVNLKFIGSLITFIITLVVIIYFIQKSIRDKLEWKIVLLFSIMILIGVYYVNSSFENILLYVFNHEYLTVKEIIKFF